MVDVGMNIAVGGREILMEPFVSKRAILFAPDFTEVSTIARAHGFLDYGFELTVFAFRRRRYNAGYKPAWPEVDLGRTQDGDYVRRALALVRALRILWRRRDLLRRADVLYARNIDQLVLALAARMLFRRRAVVAYEVLDVAEPLTRRGPLGTTLRALERVWLRRIDLLVVSSPGFVRNYFRPVQGYRGPWFLLENKLHPATLGTARRGDARERPGGGRYRWVIGYFGLIRGDRTFELMTRLAERFPEDIVFYFRGVITTLDESHFLAVLGDHPNMLFGGPYINPDDLHDLYSQIDFVWALDLERENHNSRWLLPCRLYEGGMFAVPQLAARDFEAGLRVEQLRMGWTFAPPYEESLTQFFATLTPEMHAEMKHQLSALPPDHFVSGSEALSLCQLLDTGLRKAGASLWPAADVLPTPDPELSSRACVHPHDSRTAAAEGTVTCVHSRPKR